MRKLPAMTGPAAPPPRVRGLVALDSPEAQLSPITPPAAFEAMFDGSTDLLCVRDLKGKLIRLNPAWSTRLGFSIADLRGAPLLDLVHPADVWPSHDIMHGVNTERMVLGFMNRYRTVGGGYRTFEWTARRFGEYVFGLGQAID